MLTNVKKSIITTIKRYPFECIMAIIIILTGITQLLLNMDAFREASLRSAETIFRTTLDRTLWNRRLLGAGFRRILERWIVVLFVVEVFKVIYPIDIYAVPGKLKKDLLLRKCAIATSVMMLVAHTPVYTNSLYIHDVIKWSSPMGYYFNKSDKWASYFVGLFAQGFNSQVFNMSWYSGLLTILFAILSVYYLSRLIGYDDWISIWLISGLIATNSSIINAHVYTGGQYYILVALFTVCLASFMAVNWKRSITSFIVISFLIAIVTGTYGAYMPLYPSLMIALIIIELLKGEKTVAELIRSGLWYVSILFCGMLIYYVFLKFSLWYSGTKVQAYMSEGELNNGVVSIVTGITRFIPEAYERYFSYFIGRDRYIPLLMEKIKFILNLSLIALLIFLIIIQWKKLMSGGRIILLTILLLIWPLSMNLIHILSFGNTHELMVFGLITPFLFLPKILRYMYKIIDWNKWYEKLLRTNILVMTVLFIFEGIFFANAFYTHLNNMYINSVSLATRLLDRIETIDDFSGEERVIFIGGLIRNDYYSPRSADNENTVLDIIGPVSVYCNSGFTYWGLEGQFIKYFMNCSLDIEIFEDLKKYTDVADISKSKEKVIEDMPQFPFEGSVKKLDNTIYVKLSE